MNFHIIFFILLVYSSVSAMKKDPHQIYLERYPQLHATYRKCSNEGELFLHNIKTVAQKIKSYHPDFFNNGIQLFTIGCRDGQVSKNAIDILKEYCPDNKKQISFRGIDNFPIHVKQTKKTIENGDIQHGNFETYQLTEHDKKYANFVLALQVCHFIKNIDLFIKKIKEITQQDAVILFMHSDDSSVNGIIKSLINKFRSPHVSKNICSQLEDSFKKNNVSIAKTSIKPTLKIPALLPEMAKLQQIKYEDYSNQYQEHSESFHTVKNIIELGFDRPLESFWNSTRNWALLPALKKNFAPENQLPLTTHIATFEHANSNLKEALKK